jgi:hypothetical protein
MGAPEFASVNVLLMASHVNVTGLPVLSAFARAAQNNSASGSIDSHN